MISDMRLVNFLDLETTGKFDPNHRIIECSIRQCDLDSEEEKRNVLLRFNPERNIDAAAQRVHGISLDDLKDKPPILKGLPQIAKLLTEADLNVAHNGIGFDFPYLKMEFERNGIEFPKFEVFDTMVEGTFATDLGKNPSLKELCFALDVDYDETLAHKGNYDTEVLRDCFFNGVRHGWYLV